MENYWLFYLLALFAEVIGTISGFGSSVLFVPIASLFFDFKFVLGITAAFHVFSNLSKIYLFKDGINKRIAFKMGIPALIAVIAGAALVNFLPVMLVERGMSVLIFLMCIFLFFSPKVQLATTNANLIKGGVLSGFLAGLIGTGGAIRGIVLSAFNLEKNIFIATSALIDLGVDSSRAIIYASNGYMNVRMLTLLPLLILVSFTGSWLGKKMLTNISQKWFKHIVLGCILVSSLLQFIFHFLNNP